MTAAPTALIALTAPALIALMACGLKISSRAAVAAALVFVGMLSSLMRHYNILNAHRRRKLTDINRYGLPRVFKFVQFDS
jgi:hypothetical protein